MTRIRSNAILRLATLSFVFAVVGTRAGAWEIGSGPRYHTVFETRSTFNGRVRVVEDEQTRYLLFDQSIQTGQMRVRPDRSALPYIAGLHLGFAADPDARSILVIGLGGGMLPRQAVRFHPRLQVDVVEIDPIVVKIAREFFGLPPAPKVSVAVGDGRSFLEHAAMRYDLIFLDAYDAHSAPPMLTTAEFMRRLRQRLTDRGLLVANVISAREGPRSGFGRSEFKTVQSVFGRAAVYPVQSSIDRSIPPDQYENLILLACRSGRLPAPETILRRARRLRRAEISEIEAIARRGPLKGWSTDDVAVLTDAHPPRNELFGP